jgi:hypothetical protein
MEEFRSKIRFKNAIFGRKNSGAFLSVMISDLTEVEWKN